MISTINRTGEPFKPNVTRQDLNLDGSVGDKTEIFQHKISQTLHFIR